MVDAGSRELGQTKWTRREASDHRRRSRPPPPGGSRPTLEQKDGMKQNRRDRTEAPDMLPPHDEQAEFMLLACAVHTPADNQGRQGTCQTSLQASLPHWKSVPPHD